MKTLTKPKIYNSPEAVEKALQDYRHNTMIRVVVNLDGLHICTDGSTDGNVVFQGLARDFKSEGL